MGCKMEEADIRPLLDAISPVGIVLHRRLLKM